MVRQRGELGRDWRPQVCNNGSLQNSVMHMALGSPGIELEKMDKGIRLSPEFCQLLLSWKEMEKETCRFLQ